MHLRHTLLLSLALGCASRPAPVAVTPVAVTPAPAATAPVVITSPAPGWVLPSEQRAADTSPEAARAAVDAASNVALARVVRAQEECSNLGGMHLRLEVVRVLRGAPAQTLAAGGHGVQIPIGIQVVGSTWEVAFTPGAEAHVTRGWCVDDLAPAQGIVSAIAPPR